MCTVSFVNANGKIIITSNRDEKMIRPNAIEPRIYALNNKKVIFPKDNKAGGTWLAVDDNSNIVVLLNGAEEKHVVKKEYRKSRGLIVLDLISSSEILRAWDKIDLKDIEPFTLVLFSNKKLYQLRWNETNKTKIELSTNENHIWSSSTLYSQEIRDKRAKWFYKFLETEQDINSKNILNFHRYTETDNFEHGLVINRNESLKTLSITQIVLELNKLEISYNDLISGKDFSNFIISI